MRIESLNGYASGSPVFIVGTGPSMRVFPLLREFFSHGQLIIALNQAWKYVPAQFVITVHPELYLEYAKVAQTVEGPRPRWLIKKKPPMEHLDYDDPEHYVFSTTSDLAVVEHRKASTLYIGEGIQCTAMDLAARMGAGCIFLMGCDACSLAGEHHGHDQHVRFLGQEPGDQYALYRKTTAKVRRVIREKFGIPTLTITPFVGAGHAEEDYARLCKEMGLDPLPKPKDISPYRRK